MSIEPTSDQFDPLLALSSSSSPAAGVKVFDNIQVFEANLKRKDETQIPKVSRQKEKSFSQRKRIAAEVEMRDLSRLKAMMEVRRRIDQEGGKNTGNVETLSHKQKKPPLNLFSSMEKLSVGPFNLLHRITKERLQCYVFTRHFDGLRGVLVGFITAFDRYTNLIMVDVDETFMIAPRGCVVDHVTRLTPCLLAKVSNEIKTNGVDKLRSLCTGPLPPPHLLSTGVVRVKPSTSVLNDGKSLECEYMRSSVKWYGHPHNPPMVKAQTFHRGLPQLYHRHINNLYVRGDGVVLIQLPS